jgi:hypothetical protein
MPETGNLLFGLKLEVNPRFYCPARYQSFYDSNVKVRKKNLLLRKKSLLLLDRFFLTFS